MSDTDATQPVKRGPGRPRKTVVQPAEASASSDAWKTSDKPVFPPDDRIGEDVDPRATQVGFDDGRTYRCENGKIVERVG